MKMDANGKLIEKNRQDIKQYVLFLEKYFMDELDMRIIKRLGPIK